MFDNYSGAPVSSSVPSPRSPLPGSGSHLTHPHFWKESPHSSVLLLGEPPFFLLYLSRSVVSSLTEEASGSLCAPLCTLSIHSSAPKGILRPVSLSLRERERVSCPAAHTPSHHCLDCPDIRWLVSLQGRDQVQTQVQIAGCHPQKTMQWPNCPKSLPLPTSGRRDWWKRAHDTHNLTSQVNKAWEEDAGTSPAPRPDQQPTVPLTMMSSAALPSPCVPPIAGSPRQQQLCSLSCKLWGP